MELGSVVDSVVSQFTIAKLVYKIVVYQASAKEWFATRKVTLGLTNFLLLVPPNRKI